MSGLDDFLRDEFFGLCLNYRNAMPQHADAALVALENAVLRVVVRDNTELRDQFAGQALPLSARQFSEGHIDGWEGIARHAYAIADAMLEARKGPTARGGS